jgi:hypothetical protein
MFRSCCLVMFIVALHIGFASRVAAQEPLRLTIRDGRVTLQATNESLRAILDAWADVGETRIINADRVPDARVTLQLHEVPEREALDTLLRGVSGYILALRDSSSTGASQYDRVVILVTNAGLPLIRQSTAAGGILVNELNERIDETAGETTRVVNGAPERDVDSAVVAPLTAPDIEAPSVKPGPSGSQPKRRIGDAAGITAGFSATPGVVMSEPEAPRRELTGPR